MQFGAGMPECGSPLRGANSFQVSMETVRSASSRNQCLNLPSMLVRPTVARRLEASNRKTDETGERERQIRGNIALNGNSFCSGCVNNIQFVFPFTYSSYGFSSLIHVFIVDALISRWTKSLALR